MNFPTTRWTQLANATLNGDKAGGDALNALCAVYRPPVVSFLRQRGYSGHDAEDLAHQLFQELILSKAWRTADRTKGRFRSFLLGILSHVISRGSRRSGAEKRGDGQTTLSLDELAAGGFEPAELSEEDTLLFDRQWALHLVKTALSAVAEQFSIGGKEREWAVLVRFLPGAGDTPSYEAAAAEISFSLPALKSAVHRVRHEFREALRSEVSCTVSAAHEINDELAYLHRVLSSPAH